MSIETQEMSQEMSIEPLELVQQKTKRVMSDAQRQNLVKARAKALELRNKLKAVTVPVAKEKRLTKLEKRLIAKQQLESELVKPELAVPQTPTIEYVIKPEYKFVKRDGGMYLEMVE